MTSPTGSSGLEVGVRSTTRRVRGSNYCAHIVEVRDINHIYEFNEDGDNIIVFAPRRVHGSDVSIRLLDASFVNGEIDFLRKIRENTYEYELELKSRIFESLFKAI